MSAGEAKPARRGPSATHWWPAWTAAGREAICSQSRRKSAQAFIPGSTMCVPPTVVRRSSGDLVARNSPRGVLRRVPAGGLATGCGFLCWPFAAIRRWVGTCRCLGEVRWRGQGGGEGPIGWRAHDIRLSRRSLLESLSSPCQGPCCTLAGGPLTCLNAARKKDEIFRLVPHRSPGRVLTLRLHEEILRMSVPRTVPSSVPTGDPVATCRLGTSPEMSPANGCGHWWWPFVVSCDCERVVKLEGRRVRPQLFRRARRNGACHV